MDDDINQMVAENIILMKIIIDGKRYVGYRTMGGVAFEGGCKNTFKTQFSQANMVIVSNIRQVIKNKRAMQGV
jgi:hypothetical protein